MEEISDMIQENIAYNEGYIKRHERQITELREHLVKGLVDDPHYYDGDYITLVGRSILRLELMMIGLKNENVSLKRILEGKQ